LDNQSYLFLKAFSAFGEKADVKGARAVYEALPLSLKDDYKLAAQRSYLAMCAGDFAAAEEIVSKNPNEEIFFGRALVPRQIWILWLEFVQGNHPTIEQFGGAREQLYRKVEADRTNPFLLMALAHADIALGRNEEGLQEGIRALQLRPVSEDAVDGP